ncbi:hypothetical protein C8R48DRAFT_671405 [Suillus tomentosus]|nr:hypothetical protein C8R48DRAFT_671405 [Suillus tomentosus]
MIAIKHVTQIAQDCESLANSKQKVFHGGSSENRCTTTREHTRGVVAGFLLEDSRKWWLSKAPRLHKPDQCQACCMPVTHRDVSKIRGMYQCLKVTQLIWQSPGCHLPLSRHKVWGMCLSFSDLDVDISSYDDVRLAVSGTRVMHPSLRA